MNDMVMRYHTMPRSRLKTIPKIDRIAIELLLQYRLSSTFFFNTPTDAELFKQSSQGKARDDCREKHGFHDCWSCDEIALDDLIVHIQCPIKANNQKYQVKENE